MNPRYENPPTPTPFSNSMMLNGFYAPLTTMTEPTTPTMTNLMMRTTLNWTVGGLLLDRCLQKLVSACLRRALKVILILDPTSSRRYWQTHLLLRKHRWPLSLSMAMGRAKKSAERVLSSWENGFDAVRNFREFGHVIFVKKGYLPCNLPFMHRGKNWVVIYRLLCSRRTFFRNPSFNLIVNNHKQRGHVVTCN